MGLLESLVYRKTIPHWHTFYYRHSGTQLPTQYGGGSRILVRAGFNHEGMEMSWQGQRGDADEAMPKVLLGESVRRG